MICQINTSENTSLRLEDVVARLQVPLKLLRLVKTGILVEDPKPSRRWKNDPRILIDMIQIGQIDECWPWLDQTGHFGYGILCIGYRVNAHRLVYMRVHGNIPTGGCVLHRCDNPPCVNPFHLFLGDKTINMQDKVAKGRHRVLHGVNCPRAKLSQADVDYIRAKFTSKRGNQTALARQFKVTHTTIRSVIDRITYK